MASLAGRITRGPDRSTEWFPTQGVGEGVVDKGMHGKRERACTWLLA